MDIKDFETAKIEFEKILKDFGKELTPEEIQDLIEDAKKEKKQYYYYPYYYYYYQYKQLEPKLKEIKELLDKLTKKVKSEIEIPEFSFTELKEDNVNELETKNQSNDPYDYYYYPYYYYYYYHVQLKDMLDKLLDILNKVLEKAGVIDIDEAIGTLINNEDILSAIPEKVVTLIRKYIQEGLKPTDAVKKAWEEYKKEQEEKEKEYPELKKCCEELQKENSELKNKLKELEISQEKSVKMTSDKEKDKSLSDIVNFYAYKNKKIN